MKKHRSVSSAPVGIVIPVANEQLTIIRFVLAVLTQVKKLQLQARIYFVIDTVSVDATLSILRIIERKVPQYVTVVFAPENKNVVDAYVAGFRAALKDDCHYIIEMDAGFSHNPAELGRFITALDQGYECVIGKREFFSSSYQVPVSRRIYSFGGSLLTQVFLGSKLSDITSGYEAFTATALKKILAQPLISVNNVWHIELKQRAAQLKTTQVPISYKFPSKSIRRKVVIESLLTFIALLKKRWL